jgi:hypothetical protein
MTRQLDLDSTCGGAGPHAQKTVSANECLNCGKVHQDPPRCDLNKDGTPALQTASVPDSEVSVRPSAHRAAPAQLEGGHAVRVARVVTAIYGNEAAYERSALIEAMIQEIKPLMDVSAPEATARLASFSPVLEAMFLENARRAAEARNPEHAAHFTRMSLQAHDRLQRLYALLAGMQQTRQRAFVSETGDDDS